MNPVHNPAHLLNKAPSPSAQRSLTVLARSEELHRGYCSILDFRPSFPDAGRSGLDQYRLPLFATQLTSGPSQTVLNDPIYDGEWRWCRPVETPRPPLGLRRLQHASFARSKSAIPTAALYHFGFAMITAPERSRESAEQASSPIKRCRSGVETGLFLIEIPDWFRVPVFRPPSKTDKRS